MLRSTTPHSNRPDFKFSASDLAELRDFLYSARARLKSAMTQPAVRMPEVHIVMGNESADLDSIVASIVRAYQLSLTNKDTGIYLPYINICREDLKLRKDVEYLLNQLNISTEHLSFIDDPITPYVIQERQRLNLHLVDHNKLNPKQSHLSGSVVSIIDHHIDAKEIYPRLSFKEIDVVGSCTTLVANKLFQNIPLEIIPKALAALILAPVLIDTDKLTSPTKTTPADSKLVQQLALKFDELFIDDFFTKIREKKNDISDASDLDLLGTDYKSFAIKKDELIIGCYGMSTLVSSQGFWIEDKDRLLQSLEQFAADKNIDFLILAMPFYIKKEGESLHPPQRKFVFYSKSPAILTAFKQAAEQNEFWVNHIEKQVETTNICFYSSGEYISRKVLQPVIDDELLKDDALVATIAQNSRQECQTPSSSALISYSVFPSCSSLVIPSDAHQLNTMNPSDF